MNSLPAEGEVNQDVKIVINNNQVTIPAEDQQAFIMNGRTYVPLRVISENLGAVVEWDGENKQVIITSKAGAPVKPVPKNENDDVQIIIDEKVVDIPGGYGKPFITGKGRTVVPLRLVGETLGCQVNWQEGSRTVQIQSDTAAIMPIPEYPNTPSSSGDDLLEKLASYQTNLRLLDGTLVNSKSLVSMDRSIFTGQQMDQLKNYYNQLEKYDLQIKLPGGTVINTADVTIQGEPVATADQLRSWLAEEAERIKVKMETQYNRSFNPIPSNLVDLYLKIGAEYGIRGDLAFCQAAKETHFWQFTGDVQPFQNNYCGLGAVGSPCTGQEPLNGADPNSVSFKPGVHGAVFASPEIGVEAHIQHLYAYACKDPLPPGKVIYDPRFKLVARGSAPTWQELNGRWAVPGTTYGQSIIQDYWLKALNK
ncbi:MAG: glucosaminidase domain-containing protein [Desulfotomaculum sp.]|nr:glucosaminidase domain-containing protein [Desulfotomaculum sp.]